MEGGPPPPPPPPGMDGPDGGFPPPPPPPPLPGMDGGKQVFLPFFCLFSELRIILLIF
jgi:hypothetical protein